MLLMDWKRDSTAESLVMLRPRMWLLFMRLTNVVTAFCSAFRNCSWFSSDSPFWYCCWEGRTAGQPPLTRAKSQQQPRRAARGGCVGTSGAARPSQAAGQPQAASYLDDTERGGGRFPRLSGWLCEGQRGRWGRALANLLLFLLPVVAVQIPSQLPGREGR